MTWSAPIERAISKCRVLHTADNSAPKRKIISKHRIPWSKLFDVSANCFNAPRNVSAEDCVFRFEQPNAHQTHWEGVGSQQMPIPRVDGCCIDFYQHMTFIDGRLFHLFDIENIWWSIFCVYNRVHSFSPIICYVLLFYSVVMTIFPS